MAVPRCSLPCARSEEHTSELQSLRHLVCRLLLEKKKINHNLGFVYHHNSSEPEQRRVEGRAGYAGRPRLRNHARHGTHHYSKPLLFLFFYVYHHPRFPPLPPTGPFHG